MKRRSLFTPEQKARMRKPQYRIYSDIQDKAMALVAQWFLDEFELHGNQGAILAEEIVPCVIQAARAKIHPTAPDVFLPEKDVLEWVVRDSKVLAEEMDGRDELEKILADWENRNEYEKHGI